MFNHIGTKFYKVFNKSVFNYVFYRIYVVFIIFNYKRNKS